MLDSKSRDVGSIPTVRVGHVLNDRQAITVDVVAYLFCKRKEVEACSSRNVDIQHVIS